MIVSLYVKCDEFDKIDVKMCEVNTREEAFYEMSRFLEVNQIWSNTTTIVNHEGHSMESIYMGETPGTIKIIAFSIRHLADHRPTYEHIDDIEAYLKERVFTIGRPWEDENEINVVEAYNNYLSDRIRRNGGDS